MLGLSLALTQPRGGPSLGPELLGTGAPALLGAAPAAAYNTGTGDGAVTRVDLSNQSYVTFAGLAPDSVYRVALTNPGPAAIGLRRGSATSSILVTVLAGQSVTFDATTLATTALMVTATSAATATFSVTSIRKLG